MALVCFHATINVCIALSCLLGTFCMIQYLFYLAWPPDMNTVYTIQHVGAVTRRLHCIGILTASC